MRIYLLLAMAVGASFIGSNCGGSGVGDPCVPEDEYLTTFAGFSVGEVNVESRSFQCQTRLCLVNHFQGRVSCPYGQEEDPALPKDSGRAECGANVVLDESEPGGRYYTCAGADGQLCPDWNAAVLDPVCADDGGSKCATPECQPGGAAHSSACRMPDRSGAKVEERIQIPVDAQLAERQAHDAVYCSCRCDGPDANARYCDCPSGFDCIELVEDLDLGKGQLAGSYCVKDDAIYDEKTTSGTECGESGEVCGPKCGDCEKYDAEGECKKERKEDDKLCYTVEKVSGETLIEEPRNWGARCEGSGVVCKEGDYCCIPPSSIDARGNGVWDGDDRVPCLQGSSSVSADGKTVNVCN